MVVLAASTLIDTWSKGDKELLCRVINKKVEKDKGIVADILRDRFRKWSTNAKHSIKEKSEGDDISRIIDILSTSKREHRYILIVFIDDKKYLLFLPNVYL